MSVRLDELFNRGVITFAQHKFGAMFAEDWNSSRAPRRYTAKPMKSYQAWGSSGVNYAAKVAQRANDALKYVKANLCDREAPARMCVLTAASDMQVDEAARTCGLSPEEGLTQLRYGLTQLAAFYRRD